MRGIISLLPCAACSASVPVLGRFPNPNSDPKAHIGWRLLMPRRRPQFHLRTPTTKGKSRCSARRSRPFLAKDAYPMTYHSLPAAATNWHATCTSSGVKHLHLMKKLARKGPACGLEAAALNQEVLRMNFVFESTVQQLSLVSHPGDVQAGKQLGESTRCADKGSAAAFPGEAAKVAVINVDTAGREVLLSGQEGICVQWR
jgi:hypothetical protein